MSTNTVPRAPLAWVPWALLAWSSLTFAVSLLPEGVGAAPRSVNALLFMSLGPACALMLMLRGALPPAAAVVVALGSSLGILVLSSQLLLLVDLWRDWAVTLVVAVVTVVLAFGPWHGGEER